MEIPLLHSNAGMRTLEAKINNTVIVRELAGWRQAGDPETIDFVGLCNRSELRKVIIHVGNVTTSQRSRS